MSGNGTEKRINNEEELNQWLLSIEATMNMPLMWCVIHGVFDDKKKVKKLIGTLKQRFGVDFQDCNQQCFCLTIFSYAKRQKIKKLVRKLISVHGMTLQKSSPKNTK